MTDSRHFVEPPRVSVVIPAYNHAHFLREAIDSVLGQDYGDVELIVIDDGSTDATPRILEAYDGAFRWERQANRGQSATINRGWQMATGELLSYLSADDWLAPDATRTAVDALGKCPEAVIAYGDFTVVDEQSRPMRTVRGLEVSYREMVCRLVTPPGPGVFLRRDAVEKTGGWDESLRRAPDLDYWLRLGLHGPFLHVPRILAAWRHHPGSQTAGAPDPVRATEALRIVDKLYARDDLPGDVLRVRSRAYATAHLRAAHHHLRARRWRLATARILSAGRHHPSTLLSYRGLRTLARGLLGHQHRLRGMLQQWRHRLGF